jgi:hypothetical protein
MIDKYLPLSIDFKFVINLCVNILVSLVKRIKTHINQFKNGHYNNKKHFIMFLFVQFFLSIRNF